MCGGFFFLVFFVSDFFSLFTRFFTSTNVFLKTLVTRDVMDVELLSDMFVNVLYVLFVVSVGVVFFDVLFVEVFFLSFICARTYSRFGSCNAFVYFFVYFVLYFVLVVFRVLFSVVFFV